MNRFNWARSDGGGRDGGAVGQHLRGLGKLVFLAGLQGLVGLPFAQAVVARELLHLREDHTRLGPFLCAQAGPLIHALLQFFLVLGRQVCKIGDQGDPFSFVR